MASPAITRRKYYVCYAVMAAVNKAYGSWNIAELKAELRKRGAKLDGRKQDLVER